MIDHYEADVQTAQDYYPFGMIMPGRMLGGLSIPGGTYTGTTTVNGFTLPVDLELTSRTGNEPTQYVASRSIDLDEGFESGTNDDVTAYIADTSYAGGGNGGSGADGVAGAGKYRYGFNGKEKDDEVKGIGDQIDYGMRVYDPRAGRFLSVDPLQKNYPWWSPYHFAGNSPILNVDLDGRETYNYNLTIDQKTGKSALTMTTVEHGSLFDALTVQKVNYQGRIYTIDAEWNYGHHHGFETVSHLALKSQAQLDEYFANKKTDIEISEETRKKDDETFAQASQIVFVGAALNNISAKQATSSATLAPEGATNKQTTASHGGNTNAEESNLSTETGTGGSNTKGVPYYRVQGGTPPAASKNLISIGENGSVKFKNSTLNISTGSLEHAEHFMGLRPGANVVKFEVPDWFDNFIKEYAIPQQNYTTNPANQNGLAPKIVDPTTPGTSYELPSIWSQWLNENAIQGSGEIKKKPKI